MTDETTTMIRPVLNAPVVEDALCALGFVGTTEQAEYIGISAKQLARLRRGEAAPRPSTVRLLLTATGLEYADMMRLPDQN